MKVGDKIVVTEGIYPAIFFPIGRPEDGGSCAYLTEHCLEYCPSRTTNVHEERALNFFKENDADTIVAKIIGELGAEFVMHLYWWPWGDCLPELEDKILEVMLKIKDIGVVQNGFTRNVSFWKKVPFHDILRIGFHVETEEELKAKESEGKVLCLPDVTRNKAILHYNGRPITECCGIWCEWKTENDVRIADCQDCFIHKQGCFIK